MELSKEELDQFAYVQQAINPDDKIQQVAQLVYCEYKKVAKLQIPPEKVSTIYKCAILIASHTITMKNVQGEIIRGSVIPITQLLKSNNNLDEFIFTLKEIISFSAIESEALTTLNLFIENFSFLLTFYNKYDKIYKMLDFNENSYDMKEYSKSLKSIGWLIFIASKLKLLNGKNEIIECTCLIVSTFNFIINYSLDFISSSYLSQISEGQDFKSEYFRNKLLEQLLDIFKIKDMECFKSINNTFLDYMEELIKEDIFKCNKQKGIYDFLSLNLISPNYKKLDLVYQKSQSSDSLDERFFLKERNTTYTPSKFTPFARQGNANRAPNPIEKYQNENENPNRQYNSHRMLNYELPENISIKSNFNEIKFPTNIVTSPYAAKQIQTKVETPMTTAMEMYNWLHDKEKKQKGKESPLKSRLSPKVKANIDSLVDKLCDKIIVCERGEVMEPIQLQEKKTRESRKNLIISLYQKILEDFIILEEKKGQLEAQLSNDILHRGLLVCAVESVFFILNVTKISFAKLVQIVEIQWYELWRVMDFYLRFEFSMPTNLKIHILDLEVKIVSQLAWRYDSTLYTFIKSFNNTDQQVKDHDQSDAGDKSKFANNHETHEKFFRRVLHQCAIQTYQICQQIGANEKLSEGIWCILKHILSNEPELMINRHIDQMILCSVFSICRVQHQPIKFQEIINKYEDLNPLNKQLHHEIIYSVCIDSQNQKRGDIISFYNTIFIVVLKNFIINLGKQSGSSQIKPPSPFSKNPVISQPILQSPLKQMIPAIIQNQANKKTNGKLPHHMTPQTQILYAYQESPLLKMDISTQQSSYKNLNSKKMINFDAEVKNTVGNQNNNGGGGVKQSKYSRPVMDQIMEKETESIQETTDFINKKWKNIFGTNQNASNLQDSGLQQQMLQTSGCMAQCLPNSNSTPRIIENKNQPTLGSNSQQFLKLMAQQQLQQQQQQQQQQMQMDNQNQQGLSQKFSKLNFDQFDKQSAIYKISDYK